MKWGMTVLTTHALFSKIVIYKSPSEQASMLLYIFFHRHFFDANFWAKILNMFLFFIFNVDKYSFLVLSSFLYNNNNNKTARFQIWFSICQEKEKRETFSIKRFFSKRKIIQSCKFFFLSFTFKRQTLKSWKALWQKKWLDSFVIAVFTVH